jgi:SHS2 domain-containing protein
MSEGYRTFDHTGDLGLEIWAGTPARLYALAAEVLLAQVAQVPAGPPEVQVRLRLTGDDPGDLLVHWLNTALLQAELARAVWTRAEVSALTPESLEAVLEGRRLDPRRDLLLREVKAVSHHHFLIRLEPGSCRCRLVVDL